MNPLITIAVLNRNGIDRLKKTTNSLLFQEYSNFEILYLDNGSADLSIDYLSKLSNQIRIIRNSNNEGYGRAKNRLVNESKGEYVLLLDNDIELKDSAFLQNILNIYNGLENPGFLSPLVKDVNKNSLNSLGLFYNRLQKSVSFTEAVTLGTFPIPAYMGNVVFFKKNIFLELGGFDEIYPINIDDYDLSARAYLMGCKSYMTGDCVAIHHGVDIRVNPENLKWRYKYYFAGFSRMIWKNYSTKNLVFWWPISSFWIIIKATINAFRCHNLGIIFSAIQSVRLFFQDLKSTLKERASLQKNRKVKNDIFLNIEPKVNKRHSYFNKGKFLRIAVSIILITFLLYKINWKSIVSSVAGANLLILIISGLLFFTSVLFSVLRWSRVLAFYKVSITKVKLFNLYLCGSFFSNFLPTAIGGDVYKYIVLAKKYNTQKKELLSSMMVERGIGFLTLFIGNIVLIWYYWGIIRLNLPLIIIESLIVAGFILILVAIFLRHKLMLLLDGLNFKSKIYIKIKDFFTVLNSINGSRLIMFACIYSVLFLFNVGVSTWLLFFAFHMKVSFLYAIFVVTIVNIAGILPISLNSIGITEGLNVFLLGLIGIEPGVALAASLIGRVSLLLASASGGIAYLFQQKE